MMHLSADPGHVSAARCRTADACDSGLAVLDLGVLCALIGDEPAIVRDFLTDFLVAAGRQGGALRAAAADRACGNVRLLAHNLKSSSRSVGAQRLGDACQALERAALDGDAASVAGHLVPFEAELTHAEAEIRAAIGVLDGRLQGGVA